ncbi:ankyrin repeat-containing domain protein [Aspergillus californicus]
MADDEWETHRLDIEHLYIGEKKTLAAVRDYMSANGFVKSKSQYERQFKKWGFRKNSTLPSEVDWEYIKEKVEQRKRMLSKESEVIIFGDLCPPEKLRRKFYEKGFVSTLERFRRAGVPSPPTREGIIIRTPASSWARPWFDPLAGFMRFTWRETIPWVRFCKLTQPEIGHESSVLSPASQPQWSREIAAQSSTAKAELMQRLGWIVPWTSPPCPLDASISSRLSATLSVLMPEEYEGQHQALVTNRFILELFMLSNNLSLHDTRNLSKDTIQSQDRRMIGMFRSLGGKKMNDFAQLVSREDPTSLAIAEKLFASAVRLADVGVAEIMLNAGINPNKIIHTRERPVTPLAWAAHVADNRHLKLLEALLFHGADVNMIYSGITAIFPAMRANNRRAINILLRRGATVALHDLAEATRMGDLKLFKDLLQSCNNPVGLFNECDVAPDRYCSKFSCGFLSKGSTTILGAAAKSGKLDFVRFILQTYPSLVNPDRDDTMERYYSPIDLAIAMNHTECIEPLILSGVDVNVRIAEDFFVLTSLERAIKKHNLEAVRILLNYGARIDRPLSYRSPWTSALLTAITLDFDKVNQMTKLEHIQLIDELINRGARLNDEYEALPGTVLRAAINTGDILIIERLLRAGASRLGKKFTCIGSKEAAQYLDRKGILQVILDKYGTGVVSCAIWRGDVSLAQWLVHRKALDAMGSESVDSGGLLDAATARGDLFLVDAILNSGAKVTDERLTETLYGIDSENGNNFVLRRLIREFRGSAPTAVAYAAFLGRADSLKLLLQAGIRPEGTPKQPQDGWWRSDPDDPDDPEARVNCAIYEPQSALELAVGGGSELCLDILIQSYTWSRTAVGRAMAFAIEQGERQMAEKLYKLNPKMNEVASIYTGTRPCYWHVDDDDQFDEGEVDEGDIESFTPLQAAAMRQHVTLVRRLVEVNRDDVNYPAIGARGRTALQHAVENGNLELMDFLIRHDADINADPAFIRGATALQIAAIKGYYGIAQKLIDLKANVDAPGAVIEGRTALEGAAEHGRIDTVQLLLENGAFVLAGDGTNQFVKAVRRAWNEGHNAVVKLIESFDPDYRDVSGFEISEDEDDENTDDTTNDQDSISEDHGDEIADETSDNQDYRVDQTARDTSTMEEWERWLDWSASCGSEAGKF